MTKTDKQIGYRLSNTIMQIMYNSQLSIDDLQSYMSSVISSDGYVTANQIEDYINRPRFKHGNDFGWTRKNMPSVVFDLVTNKWILELPDAIRLDLY